MIPIYSYGHAQSHPSLYLDNVLHAPKLIKNLIFFRKFTIDNNDSTEFDPLGFFVKALGIGNKILRLIILLIYPSTFTFRTQPTTFSPYMAFSTFSSNVWHPRLGHPSNDI